MKRSKMPADPNRRAKATVDIVDAILDRWPEPVPQEKDPERVARGKLGGSKGGKRRAEKLSPERRAEIARKAAAARWGKR
ncbi:MAG: histone H1 [Chloroflexi bacterium]|nr:histone H1 [Chloroflexota bacterium]